MKKKILFPVIILSAIFFSCKKDTTNPPAGSAGTVSKIKTETGDWGTTTHTYDAAGRVILSTYSNGGKVEYEYLPGKVNQKVFNQAGVYTMTYQFELNAEGLTGKETYSNNPQFTETRLYNSEKQLIKAVSFNGVNTQSIDYFYSNGNRDSLRFNNNGNWTLTIKRTFYTDKSNNLDYVFFGKPFDGSQGKNLLKSEQYCYPDGSSLPLTTYQYEWNAEGKVTKQTITQGGNINIVYYTF